MKLLLACLMISHVALAQNKPATTTYKVIPEKTKILWEGTKVTGKHNGDVKVKEGHLIFKAAELSGGEIIVDMNSMVAFDLADDKPTSDKFIGHMKSADFFHTEKYPTSRLVIKETKKAGKDLQVKGELTMIGQTHPVDFKVTEWKWSDKEVSGQAKLKLDRTKWGLKYGSGQFFKGLGDKMIHDDFALDIHLFAKRQ